MKKGLIVGIVIVLIIAGIIAFYFMRTPTLEKTGDGQGTVSGEGSIVSIKNLNFNPTTANIKAGESITWKNEDSVIHDLTNDAVGNIKEGEMFALDVEPGKSFTFVFENVGEYDYHCDIHPQMKGKIIVK